MKLFIRLFFVAVTILLSACGGRSSSAESLPAVQPSTSTTAAVSDQLCAGSPVPATYKHVVWIWLENKDTTQVVGSKDAPFLTDLSKQCGTASHYGDLGVHPSEPNYIEATSGATQGIHDDSDATKNAVDVNNLFRQVRAAGLTTKTYAEDMPQNRDQTSSGKYGAKHNPEVFYSAAADQQACKQDNVPFSEFQSDLSNHALPNFVDIVPNLCDDMHDCSVATGDTWMRGMIGSLTSSPEYAEGSTAVFVVFDESEGSKYMPFVAVAKSVHAGTNTDAQLSHPALLRATEEMLGINDYLGLAKDSPGLRTAFGM